MNEDLTEAARIAVREAIDFLVIEKHLSRDDAYMLSSVAADFCITQAVDGNKGVHAMIPKSLFKGSAASGARGASGSSDEKFERDRVAASDDAQVRPSLVGHGRHHMRQVAIVAGP